MGQEKSYDSLPNFTAVDCLRWAGAVIEHVNNLQPTTAHPNTQVSIIWAFFLLVLYHVMFEGSSKVWRFRNVVIRVQISFLLWVRIPSNLSKWIRVHAKSNSKHWSNWKHRIQPSFSLTVHRLLGIGRNQYIDLMNQTRSKTKFGGFSTSLFRKSYRDLLPVRPVSDLVILPWWAVQVGLNTVDNDALLSTLPLKGTATTCLVELPSIVGGPPPFLAAPASPPATET